MRSALDRMLAARRAVDAFSAGWSLMSGDEQAGFNQVYGAEFELTIPIEEGY
jgi:hypothetical protein